MAKRTIPNSRGQIRQVNEGDKFGELWSTFGIDLKTSLGKIKTSKRLDGTMAEVQMDNDNVMAIATFEDKTWVFATGNRRMNIFSYRNPRTSGSWVSASGSSDYGQETDTALFNGFLLISTGTDIQSYNGSSFDNDYWTNVLSGTALSVGKPHTLEVINSGQETLFVTDDNVVRYYNTTAGHDSFTLQAEHVACSLTSSLDRVWAGTYTNSGNALVYELAVGNTIASNAFEIDGQAVLSMATIDNTPYIVTDKGHIQAFNGVGFVTVGSFPFAFKSVVIDGLFPGDIEDSNIERAIHPRGMRSQNETLFIYVNTHNELIDQLASNPLDDDDIFDNQVVDERSPSGVWEFEAPTGNLNHRYALTHGSDSEGYHQLSQSGPILVTDNQYTKLLVGGRVESDRTELFADATSGNYGYFVTPEYHTDSVTETFESVAISADQLVAGDKINLKYRTTKVKDYPITSDVTWLESTIFTTTDTRMADASEGDEVEILSGTGAGKTAHITEIIGTTTIQVTVDSDIGGALNTTSTVRVDNWILHPETYTEDDKENKVFGIGDNATMAQFKVVMDGDITINKLAVKGNSKTEQ